MFVVTLLVYAPSLGHAFADWDDLPFIARNPHFNPPTWAGVGYYWRHVAWNLYQPLSMTAWAAAAWLGQVPTADRATGSHLNPAAFHLLSAALHAGAAAAAFALCRRAAGGRAGPAAVGALLFAVHPVQVEAVAFAGVMNVPLCGCLGLWALVLYLAGVDPAGRRRPAAVAAVVLLTLATLARPTAVVLVPVAWLLDGAAFGRPWRARARSLVPWAVVATACAAWTVAIQHGAEAARSPAVARPLVAADAVTTHLRHVVWPVTLGIDYGRSPEVVLHGPRVGLAATVAVTVALLAAAVATRRRSPWASAGVGVFVVGLLPNAGLVPFDFQPISTVADRYVYVAMLGPALLATAAMAWAAAGRWAYGVAVAVAIACVVRTEQQLATWRNGEAVFRQALSANPESWMARTNLAYALADDDPATAARLCRESLARRPGQPIAWNTLGSILIHHGDRPAAAAAFDNAHALAPADPTYAANVARARGGGNAER